MDFALCRKAEVGCAEALTGRSFRTRLVRSDCLLRIYSPLRNPAAKFLVDTKIQLLRNKGRITHLCHRWPTRADAIEWAPVLEKHPGITRATRGRLLLTNGKFDVSSMGAITLFQCDTMEQWLAGRLYAVLHTRGQGDSLLSVTLSRPLMYLSFAWCVIVADDRSG